MTTVVKTEVANDYFHVSLSDGSTNEFHLGARTASMIGSWCESRRRIQKTERRILPLINLLI